MKIHTKRDIFEGVVFFWGGGVKFLTNENVNIWNDYRVSDIARIGVKFSRWGKNSLGGAKIYQVGTL